MNSVIRETCVLLNSDTIMIINHNIFTIIYITIILLLIIIKSLDFKKDNVFVFILKGRTELRIVSAIAKVDPKSPKTSQKVFVVFQI